MAGDGIEKAFRRLQRDVGLRLREVRAAAGFTQAQAAERVGMSADNYVKIERGRRNVTLHTIAKVAYALGIAPATLFEPPTERHPRPGRPRKDRK